MYPLVTFSSWEEVLGHVRAGRVVWYQAPLDSSPRLVRTTARPHGRTVRVKPWSSGRKGHCAPFDAFTADKGHLDRFRKQDGPTTLA